jgi:3-oxoacyl-[acyl-carrier protein] reductase/7-alpha-hydroxysteroid dehydrogenase
MYNKDYKEGLIMDFKDKIVIVTGGTRGIGKETVKAFIKHNATVILFGSKKESVDNAINDLAKENIKVEGYYPNLNNYEEVEEVITKIYNKYKHIDILINNAGVSQQGKITDIDSNEFERIMALNVNAMFNTSKAVVKYMKEQSSGVILNTSSMVSKYGQPSGIAYPTSKFAVNGFTLSLARELAEYNIRVNAVAPGITNTDMVKNLPDNMIKPLIESIPLKRIGEPRDIANAFLFLASPYASYITGVVLPVDGLARS